LRDWKSFLLTLFRNGITVFLYLARNRLLINTAGISGELPQQEKDSPAIQRAAGA
jgi:hypothetical protein